MIGPRRVGYRPGFTEVEWEVWMTFDDGRPSELVYTNYDGDRQMTENILARFAEKHELYEHDVKTAFELVKSTIRRDVIR